MMCILFIWFRWKFGQVMGLEDYTHKNGGGGERGRVSGRKECAQGIEEIGRKHFLTWFDTSLIQNVNSHTQGISLTRIGSNGE